MFPGPPSARRMPRAVFLVEASLPQSVESTVCFRRFITMVFFRATLRALLTSFYFTGSVGCDPVSSPFLRGDPFLVCTIQSRLVAVPEVLSRGPGPVCPMVVPQYSRNSGHSRAPADQAADDCPEASNECPLWPHSDGGFQMITAFPRPQPSPSPLQLAPVHLHVGHASREPPSR